jgi:LPXTG-motif cell wall-anchored protein
MRGDPHDVSRRDVLRRAGTLGVVTVWAAPVVQSLSGTAWAAGTGSVEVEGTKTPGTETSSPPVKVEGTKLPHTGASSSTETVVVTGAGLVAAGAAAVAVARRRHPATDDAAPAPRHRRH